MMWCLSFFSRIFYKSFEIRISWLTSLTLFFPHLERYKRLTGHPRNVKTGCKFCSFTCEVTKIKLIRIA